MLKMELLTEREFHALLVLAYCDIGKLWHLFTNFETNMRERISFQIHLLTYQKN